MDNMNLKNRTLFFLAERIIERNSKFKNIHEGESCYLFGNGASLKYFDLQNFSDKPAIACGAFFLHQDFRKINVKYYYEGEPFFYYPYWKNPYTRKFNRNFMGGFYKRKVLLNNDIPFFCSLSNYFGIRGEHIYYVHHFDTLFNGFSNCRLDGSFTSMASALSGMLSLAVYMGFKDVTLVGCDYTFFPRARRHFYEYGKPIDEFDSFVANESFLVDIQKHTSICTIIPDSNYKSNILPYVNYKEFTGSDPKYKENNEILSNSDLLELDRTGMQYEIFP